MKPITHKEWVSLHITGLIALLYHAFLVSFFGTTFLFLLAQFYGVLIPVGSVLGHLFSGFLLITLWPGQQFWTIRVMDHHFQDRTVLGALSEVEIYYADPEQKQ